MKISSLLNPVPDHQPPLDQTVSQTPQDTQIATWTVPQGKQKSSKMQSALNPRFDKRDTKGNINFPVHETSSSATRAQMSRFNIYPQGEHGKIYEFPRSIPYASDKRTFTAGTGRDGFQVFQYTFNYLHKEDLDERRTYTSKDPEWHVLWDYNVGFVRMTPFFKAYDFPKTQPARVIDQNPGLRDISHSITGGALVAQGYWLPFHVAKAIAAAFCWKIRYALVPMFGVGFVNECIHPHDPAFNRWTIDQVIVDQARAALMPPKLDIAASAKLTASHANSQGRSTKRTKASHTASPSPGPLSKPSHMRLRPRDASKTYAVDNSDIEEESTSNAMLEPLLIGQWTPVNRGSSVMLTETPMRSDSSLVPSNPESTSIPQSLQRQGALKRKRPTVEEREEAVSGKIGEAADGRFGRPSQKDKPTHQTLTWENASDLERDAVLGLLKLKTMGDGWIFD